LSSRYPKLPLEIEDLAYETWQKYKCHRFTYDSRGRCNPIVVYSFFRWLYFYLKRLGVPDIKTTIAELIDHIDPDLEREENAKLLMNLVPKVPIEKKGLDELENLLESYIEMQKAYEEEFYQYLAEEWGGLRPDTVTTRQYREFLRKRSDRIRERLETESKPRLITEYIETGIEKYLKTAPKVEAVRVYVYKPVSKEYAWRLFKKKVEKLGANPEAYREEFERAWETTLKNLPKEEIERKIDKLVDYVSSLINMFEMLTPEARIEIAKKIGVPLTAEEFEKKLIDAIRNRTLTKDMLLEFKERFKVDYPCARLFNEGLISYREYDYCMDVWLG